MEKEFDEGDMVVINPYLRTEHNVCEVVSNMKEKDTAAKALNKGKNLNQ